MHHLLDHGSSVPLFFPLCPHFHSSWTWDTALCCLKPFPLNQTHTVSQTWMWKFRNAVCGHPHLSSQPLSWPGLTLFHDVGSLNLPCGPHIDSGQVLGPVTTDMKLCSLYRVPRLSQTQRMRKVGNAAHGKSTFWASQNGLFKGPWSLCPLSDSSP